MPSKVLERVIEVTSELGFPTQVYYSMIGWLDKNDYTFKKTNDWLYINPKTAQHAEVAQRRQAIEQRLSQVMIAVGDLRRDVELLKHDLRKFEGALEHHRKNDLDVLKSDFVDFIDAQSQSSMLKLAAAGRFPTVVIDFFRVKSEKDIDDLKVSKSEKSILKIKWKIFQQWRESFSKGVEDRVRVLREEVNSRQASLDNYKASIRPYLEAIHKIRLSEEHPTDLLTDPTLIEGYLTSVAGVELAAWRGVSLPGKQIYPNTREYKPGKENRFGHYIFFDIKIKRRQSIVKGKEIETMNVTITSYLYTAEEVEKREKEIKAQEESILRSLEEFRGEKELEKPTEEKKKKEETTLGWAKRAIKGAPRAIIPSADNRRILSKVVYEQTVEFYDAIKESSGSIKFKRYPLEGR